MANLLIAFPKYGDSAGRTVPIVAEDNGDGTYSLMTSGGGGAGTVTSVGWTGGIVSVADPTTTPAFTIAGTSGGVPYFNSASTWATSAALAANAIVIGGGAGAAPATTTTGTGVLTALGINVGSAGSVLVQGSAISGTTITATTKFLAPDGSAAAPSYSFSNVTNAGMSGSVAAGVLISTNGATRQWSFDNNGTFSTAGGIYNGTSMWINTPILSLAGTVTIGATAPASATSQTTRIKSASTISDNAATGILTVTIPNAAHSASLRVRLVGSIGAGGAIGPNEATGTIECDFAITRTAGLNAVVGGPATYGSTAASVAGGTTITVTGSASAVDGGASAVNTFNVEVTIAKGDGASDNHSCLIEACIANANASGITIA